MISESVSGKKPQPMASQDVDTDNLTPRRASVTAAKLIKHLSSGKSQSVSENDAGKRAMEGALRTLNEPRKTLDGTLKAWKRLSISQDRNVDGTPLTKHNDSSLSVNEQGIRKLSNAFRKLGKVQIGIGSLV